MLLRLVGVKVQPFHHKRKLPNQYLVMTVGMVISLTEN